MPKLHHVKANRDYPEIGVKKGEMYYHWSFRYGGKRKSKNRPKPSQMTNSPFLSEAYSINEDIEALEAKNFESMEDLVTFCDEIIERANELSSQCQDSLDNLPDSLRDSSPTGEMLQTRVDNVENFVSEMESARDNLDEEDIEAAIEEIQGVCLEAE